MRQSPSDIAAIGLFGCALILTTLVVKREVFPSSPAEVATRRVFPAPKLLLAGRTIGPDSAPVTIVEFSDFQCPFCAKALPVLDSVRAKYPRDVKIVYRHLPLETLHPHAWTAALASECAGDQGRFQQYHDILFRVQDSIGRIDWGVLANRAGVSDTEAFALCLKKERHTNAIERDVLVARGLGLRGTPVFVIGEELVEGAPSVAWLSRRIDRSLAKR